MEPHLKAMRVELQGESSGQRRAGESLYAVRIRYTGKVCLIRSDKLESLSR